MSRPPDCTLFAALLRAVAALAAVAATAAAQTLGDLRDELRRAAVDARQTAFLAAMVDLAIEPELSGGRMRIDGEPDLVLSILKVPLHFDLDLGEDQPQLHIECNFGY